MFILMYEGGGGEGENVITVLRVQTARLGQPACLLSPPGGAILHFSPDGVSSTNSPALRLSASMGEERAQPEDPATAGGEREGQPRPFP